MRETHLSPPRVLIVSSFKGGAVPLRYGLEEGGLPARLALRDLLIDAIEGAAARGEDAPFIIDTLHIPYQEQNYDADLLDEIVFRHRYDVALSHLVLDSGARVTEAFFAALVARALEPHGQLLNRVSCIRKTTLHETSGLSKVQSEPMPCIIKLDRNFNRQETVFLCRSQADVDAWRHQTPEAEQAAFVREPFYVDYRWPEGGVYRLERWMVAFGDLAVECRFSDEFFVKASTSFRYQLRDMRRLEEDWRLLGAFGWSWREQSVDCAYDEDADAWDARYRVVRQIMQDFALDYGEFDVIRTGRNEFRVIDVTHTGGMPIMSRYWMRLMQAMFVQRVRDVAARRPG